MQETLVQSMPGSGRFSREGNCNPLQHSRLGNPMDRGAWQAIVHGITKESDMTEVTEHTHEHTRYTHVILCNIYIIM